MKKRLFLFLALTNIFVIYAADDIELCEKDGPRSCTMMASDESYRVIAYAEQSCVLLDSINAGEDVYDASKYKSEELGVLQNLLMASCNRDVSSISDHFYKNKKLVIGLAGDFDMQYILGHLTIVVLSDLAKAIKKLIDFKIEEEHIKRIQKKRPASWPTIKDRANLYK